MKTFGGYLFFFGIGSIILYFFNMEFSLLSWIENWGSTVGWVIRGALTVVGGALWLFGRKAAAPAAAA